ELARDSARAGLAAERERLAERAAAGEHPPPDDAAAPDDALAAAAWRRWRLVARLAAERDPDGRLLLEAELDLAREAQAAAQARLERALAAGWEPAVPAGEDPGELLDRIASER